MFYSSLHAVLVNVRMTAMPQTICNASLVIQAFMVDSKFNHLAIAH